jgi:hypothetical protein
MTDQKPSSYQTMIKLALVKRYASGQGGCHSPGKNKSPSRRDETRAYLAEHPEVKINLRPKTGSPQGFTPPQSSGKNLRAQVPAKRKKDK